MVLILIFAALAALAIGAGVAFFFIGRHAGATDFKRYVRKNPKPIGEEEYFGITKEIDRRIGILQKWIAARQGTKADVSAACLELMKLFDIRQYLALSEIRDRAAARLYAKDFLQKRTDEIYDLYAELYGSDVARRTVATPTSRLRFNDEAVERPSRQQPAAETSAGASSSSETSEGAAAQAQTTAAGTPTAAPAPAQSDGTAAQPAPAQPVPAPTETTTAAPNAPNGGK